MRRQLAIAALPFDLPRKLAAFVTAEAEKLGLVAAGEGGGTHFITRDGESMPAHDEWCWSAPNEAAIYETALSMLRKIAREHGAGRVWTFPNLALVFPLYDDGALVWLDGDKPAVKLCARYFHAADARPIEPPDHTGGAA